MLTTATTGRRCLRGLCALLSLLAGLASAPAAQEHTEASVKSALLYNFARFVSWPEEHEGDELVVCLIGVEDAAVYAKTIEGKDVRGRRIKVLEHDSGEACVECDMIYLGKDCDQNDEVLSKYAGRPVLTVSEDKDFLDAGGMIEIYRTTDRKLRFLIDHETAAAAGLKCSSKLLRLAHRARRG